MATRKASKRKRGPLAYRFDHVLLWVTDEQTSFEFYAQTLGLPVIHGEREKGLYAVGTPAGFTLMFHQKGLDEEGTGMTVNATGASNVHFDFDVPDVDATYALLSARGVKFVSPPKDMPWGERHTWLLDPDGYILGLSSPIRPRGRRAPST